MTKAVVILFMFAIAACASDKSAPLASGAWVPLNPVQWDVDPATASQPLMPKARS